jgi:hypothetical protein
MTSPKIAMKRVRIGAGLVAEVEDEEETTWGITRRIRRGETYLGTVECMFCGEQVELCVDLLLHRRDLPAIARFMTRLAREGRGKR